MEITVVIDVEKALRGEQTVQDAGPDDEQYLRKVALVAEAMSSNRWLEYDQAKRPRKDQMRLK